MIKTNYQFRSNLTDIFVFAIIKLTTVGRWGTVLIILAILFGIMILAIPVAEGLFIATLFTILLPNMADGAGKLALMVGLPAAAIIGDISLFAKIFKVGGSR